MVKALAKLAAALGCFSGNVELRALLAEVVRPIACYDAQHQSDLLRTLRVYLAANGNITATAELLFLHRNSVLYRLQRIEELSGLELREASVRLTLLVAFALTDPSFLCNIAGEKEKG